MIPKRTKCQDDNEYYREIAICFIASLPLSFNRAASLKVLDYARQFVPWDHETNQFGAQAAANPQQQPNGGLQ